MKTGVTMARGVLPASRAVQPYFFSLPSQVTHLLGSLAVSADEVPPKSVLHCRLQRLVKVDQGQGWPHVVRTNLQGAVERRTAQALGTQDATGTCQQRTSSKQRLQAHLSCGAPT